MVITASRPRTEIDSLKVAQGGDDAGQRARQGVAIGPEQPAIPRKAGAARVKGVPYVAGGGGGGAEPGAGIT